MNLQPLLNICYYYGWKVLILAFITFTITVIITGTVATIAEKRRSISLFTLAGFMGAVFGTVSKGAFVIAVVMLVVKMGHLIGMY